MAILEYPPFLQWEVCYECNHNCVHCYNYWRSGNTPIEKCENLELIADEIIKRKPLYLAITGGEPLLMFNQIKRIMEKIVNSGIKISISTNGTLINEERVIFFKNHGIELVISLPSIDPKVCDEITQGKNVVSKLSKVWPLLKKYDIPTTCNIVVNKANINTLLETILAVKKIGFEIRVGIAQKPINASELYDKYELSNDDFDKIIKICVEAKEKFNAELDLSVCLPDCAFKNQEDLRKLTKGSCFGGSLSYAIAVNGDIKACQCDTKSYGNILKDNFIDVYKRMVERRDGSLIPEECKKCVRFTSCRGGCRVETYANRRSYSDLPSFSNPKLKLKEEEDKIEKFSNVSKFKLDNNAKFLKDVSCYRASVGIIPTYLSFEFGDWLKNNSIFTYHDILNATKVNRNVVDQTLQMLIDNHLISKIENE